ncbi:MAG: hypothetical protein LQ347_003092 [Umbilicaria vellea]|nr:MAG: hypothetical protein LQ347_003092 [Umbilicaria vellea]
MSSRYFSNSSGSKQTKSKVPTSTSSKTRRSSAYDNDFEQHLTDNRIYIRNRKSKPGLEGFYEALQQPRPSLSPSRFPDDAFEGFQQKNEDVIDEGDVMRNVVPIMCGNAAIPSRQNLLFTRLDPIANNTTVDAKPDFYDGAHLEDIDKQVQQDLGSYIIPTGHTMAPAAPNFFLEVKRPSGGADVAKRQACYDGALGARGMHQLQSYKQEPIYDGNAYTITTTYHAGNLNMYVTHVTSSGPEVSPEYHMSQVGGWNTIGDPDTCRRAFAAFRNGRDRAQEQRDKFILAANERARSTHAEPSPFESFDHNTCSDPTGVQDISNLTQAEDPVNGPQYYMSHQNVQGRYNREPLNSASEFNDTHIAEAQEAAKRGAGYICADESTLESSHYNDNSEYVTAGNGLL